MANRRRTHFRRPGGRRLLLGVVLFCASLFLPVAPAFAPPSPPPPGTELIYSGFASQIRAELTLFQDGRAEVAAQGTGFATRVRKETVQRACSVLRALRFRRNPILLASRDDRRHDVGVVDSSGTCDAGFRSAALLGREARHLNLRRASVAEQHAVVRLGGLAKRLLSRRLVLAYHSTVGRSGLRLFLYQDGTAVARTTDPRSSGRGVISADVLSRVRALLTRAIPAGRLTRLDSTGLREDVVADFATGGLIRVSRRHVGRGSNRAQRRLLSMLQRLGRDVVDRPTEAAL